MMRSRIEPDGTTRLPEQVRERLGLDAGDEVEFVLENGHVILRPRKKDIREIRGMLSHLVRNPVSVEEMNQAIKDAVASKNS